MKKNIKEEPKENVQRTARKTISIEYPDFWPTSSEELNYFDNDKDFDDFNFDVNDPRFDIITPTRKPKPTKRPSRPGD